VLFLPSTCHCSRRVCYLCNVTCFPKFVAMVDSVHLPNASTVRHDVLAAPSTSPASVLGKRTWSSFQRVLIEVICPAHFSLFAMDQNIAAPQGAGLILRTPQSKVSLHQIFILSPSSKYVLDVQSILLHWLLTALDLNIFHASCPFKPGLESCRYTRHVVPSRYTSPEA